MSLEIILGNASSGKSRALLQHMVDQALAQPEKTHLLLVPEQFCLSAQRALVALHPRHALLNIEALSFDRLAARCFRELSTETTDIITDTAKSLFVSLAVKDCRGRLQVYGRQALGPGFVGRLSSLFAEWTMNDLGPERLRELAEEESLPPLLRRKLADLALLFEAFKKRLGDKQTAEELLPRFARLLPRSSVGRADHLYLDGFTGFTTVQYRILETLLGRCGNSSVLLTMPPEEAESDSPGDLFSLSRLTLQRLTACAERAGRKTHIRAFAPVTSRDWAWSHMGKHLFRSKAEVGWLEPPEGIHLAACADPEGEAALASRLIRHLTGEKGLRYQEIAITVSDQDLYLPLLRRELEEAGIPFFADRREPLKDHPLIRFLGDALEAVEKGFARDGVLRVLKNPAAPLEREAWDRFENYCLAAGIRRGRAFTEPFTRTRRRRRGESPEAYELVAREEMEAMEGLRLQGMGPLVALKEALGREVRAADGAKALSRFLADMGLPERLPSLEEERLLLKEGGAAWPEVLAQVEAFLESIVAILGEMSFSLREFSQMIRAALESLSSGRLPMGPDQILIGNLERSRLGEIRSLIFLGMNEGLVPRKGGEGRLITDHERLALSFFEEDLGYTDARALEEVRFYLYSLLLKPRDSLFLSYARRGAGSDKEQLPSFVIEEIKKIFPHLAPRHIHPREVFGAGEGTAFAPIRLSPGAAETLYGKTLHTSISGLEDFGDCPYRFFMGRGLELQERQDLVWGSTDHGLFFHKVLELMLTRMKEAGSHPRDMSPEEKEAVVCRAMEEAGARLPLPGGEESGESRYSLARWQHYFLTYLEYLGEKGLEDGYVPIRFELAFGARDGQAACLDLGEGHRLQLSGVIDRLDIKEQGEDVFLRVVDYKTRKAADFKPEELTEGISLQLPVYLDIALRLYEKSFPGRTLKPGGLCYGSLAEQLVAWEDSPELIRRALWKKMDLKGLKAKETVPIQEAGSAGGRAPAGQKSARALELTTAYARDKMRHMAEEIYAGDITPAPRGDRERGSCVFCAYKPLCPFDEARKGCEFRGQGPSAKDAWDMILKQQSGKEEENAL